MSVEFVRKALDRSFVMGQNYWADADSESRSANRRSDVTRQNFNTMRDAICEATATVLTEKDALLRQALEALENGARVRNAEGGTKYQPPIEEAAIEAIRTHLGVKSD